MNKDYKLVTTLRVRYSETDQMGVVYNAHYLDWFEVARAELSRSWGKSCAEWESDGILLPVVESHCRYKHPARYDEQIQLWCRVSEVTTHSVVFEYRLLRVPDYKLIAEGWTKHGIMNRQGHLYKGENAFYLWIAGELVDESALDTKRR